MNFFAKRNRPWVAYDAVGYPHLESSFFDPAEHSWVQYVESHWETIRDELIQVVQRDRGLLEAYPDLAKTNRRGAWKTAGMMYWTFKSRRFVSVFPKTWDILKQVPHLTSASMLLLEPSSTIRPHIGDTNAMMRCHLGLVIPAPAPRCGFRVGGTVVSWREGKILMFNDAHEHTAWNNTDKDRYILSFDVVRPEFLKWKRWVAAQVLGNIYLDLLRQDFAWFRRWCEQPRLQRALRTLSKLYFRVRLSLGLPLPQRL
jgi:aspartyl/asparaginyl beta-hydroxylase (cupin superfamily)